MSVGYHELSSHHTNDYFGFEAKTLLKICCSQSNPYVTSRWSNHDDNRKAWERLSFFFPHLWLIDGIFFVALVVVVVVGGIFVKIVA